MPSRDRGVIHTVVTVVTASVILGLIVALAYDIGVSRAERQARAVHNTERHTQSAEDGIKERCLRLGSPAEVAECAAKEVKAAEDARHSEYDLSAQQDMAYSAFWMIWVSVSSVAVTAGGVVLVWRTLFYTRETLREAGNATRAAQESVAEARKVTKSSQATVDLTREALLSTDRAWIKIDVKLTSQLVFGSDRISVKGRFTLHNIGKSPATHVRVFGDMHPNIIEAGVKVQEAKRLALLSMYDSGGFGRVLFPVDDPFVSDE